MPSATTQRKTSNIHRPDIKENLSRNGMKTPVSITKAAPTREPKQVDQILFLGHLNSTTVFDDTTS